MSKSYLNNFVFNKIKIEAKLQKKKSPNTSLSKLRDQKSIEIAKIRHFHEAKKLNDKYALLFPLQENSGLCICSYCNLEYYSDIPEDRKAHEMRHRQYEEFEYERGYLPLSYKQREKLKTESYKAIQGDGAIEERVSGALGLFRAHFSRSIEAALIDGYWESHPNLESYISYADYDEETIPVEIMKVIREKYGRIECEINSGSSYWYPAHLR